MKRAYLQVQRKVEKRRVPEIQFECSPVRKKYRYWQWKLAMLMMKNGDDTGAKIIWIFVKLEKAADK